ncbi:hypothetical protein PGTUg99_009915 [Puccinia graminis f. sp. tritici]|uniref:Uncharacterized protein n=1 Tax=Puccinia graminis f. sp. tritici TaxID=56615 RepID=A0A5B0LKH0_PUCGR|nr:hypothetical protein PGTUg99_009915 [Puccinia graminis f. sp. tritici]
MSHTTSQQPPQAASKPHIRQQIELQYINNFIRFHITAKYTARETSSCDSHGHCGFDDIVGLPDSVNLIACHEIILRALAFAVTYTPGTRNNYLLRLRIPNFMGEEPSKELNECPAQQVENLSGSSMWEQFFKCTIQARLGGG